jgi:hypothetical protein
VFLDGQLLYVHFILMDFAFYGNFTSGHKTVELGKGGYFITGRNRNGHIKRPPLVTELNILQ